MKLTKLVEDLYQQMTGKTDDHEVEMAVTDLRSLAHRAAALADHFEKEGTSDLEGWAEALSRVSKDEQFVRQLSVEAKVRSSLFSWAASKDSLLSLYEQAS